MNLEDMIRSSADQQARRYRTAVDLIARADRRRRQRAARRVAAAGAAAGVTMVGGALLLSNPLGESDRSVPAAQPTVAAVVESTETPWTTDIAPPKSTTTATTPASTDPTTTVPATTGPPETTARSTEPPPTAPPTTLHPATPPAYPSGGGQVWTFGEFWNVPQLGSEHQVRGTGCGSSTTIPDVIPDGLWAAYITSHDETHVGLDLLCVYAVPDASALPNPGANVVLDTPDYVIVNNQTRARPMPMDGQIVLRLGVRTDDGRCVDGTSTVAWSDIPADRQTWVRIHEGRVTWVFADCAPT